MKAVVVSHVGTEASHLVAALESWGWEAAWAGEGELFAGPEPPVLAVLLEGGSGPPAEEILAALSAGLPTAAMHVIVIARREAAGRAPDLVRLGADDCLPWESGLQALELRVRAIRRTAERYTDLVTARRDYRERALRDDLTGVFSRRAILEILERELQRAAREEGALGVLRLDVDHSDAMGTRFGHAAGDTVLRSVSTALCEELRPYDAVGRYGGEEFLVVLPGCGRPEVVGVAERLRARIQDLRVEGPGRVTLSIGVSWHRGAAPWPAERHVAAADAALYRARRAGRHRVAETGGEPARGPGSHRPRLVVIDDNRIVRDLCRRALRPVGEVLAFASLQQAEPHLERVDLVVTDLQMPEQGGLEVLHHLRSRGLAVPVLVITGADPGTLELIEIRSTGVPVLGKPFEIPVLLEQVRGLLRKRPPRGGLAAARLDCG